MDPIRTQLERVYVTFKAFSRLVSAFRYLPFLKRLFGRLFLQNNTCNSLTFQGEELCRYARQHCGKRGKCHGGEIAL